jgi:hypothetical protein
LRPNPKPSRSNPAAFLTLEQLQTGHFQMDGSIKLITPELMRELGAEDYSRGLGVNDHGMNPGAAAIKDWQFGWHTRRNERSRLDGNQVQQLEVSPP